MADTLPLWEADPFFPAAEEVQNSTDRMESIYRTWKYTEGLARSNPQDASIVSATEMNKRDLMTALDTVRWQLEEFDKAVGLATAGEDARSRHMQFVGAIYSQIDKVQMEVGEFCIPKYKNASNEDADRECLALFLSGSEPDQPLLRVRVATAQAQAAELSDDDEADTELPTVSPRVNGGQRVNGFAHHNHPSSSPKYDDDADGSSWWSRLRLWATFRAKQQQYGFTRLQLSDSGLKRWKDGDDGSFLECICALKERCMGDMEQGAGRNSMCRKACSPPRPMDELSNSSSSSSGSSNVLHRRLQGAQQGLSFWSALQVAGAVVGVVLLMCLYFWLLSRLVPFDHIPGNSLS